MAADEIKKSFDILVKMISDETYSETLILQRLRELLRLLEKHGGRIENMMDDGRLNLLQRVVVWNRKSLIKVFLYTGEFNPLYKGYLMKPAAELNWKDYSEYYSAPKLAQKLGLGEVEEELNECSDWEESVRTLPAHWAARAGDLVSFRTIFNGRGKHIKERDIKGYHVLHWAVIGGNLDIIRTLVASGVSVNETLTQDNRTVLHIAVEVGNSSLVGPLVNELKVNPNLIESNHRKAIHISALTGDLDCLQELVKSDLDPELELYTLAIQYNRSEYIEELLNLYCLPISSQNVIGTTGFLAACAYGRLEIVRLFLEDNTFVDVCTPNSRTKLTRRNAFHFAALHSSVELASLLIEYARNSSETLLIRLLNAQAKFHNDDFFYIVRGKNSRGRPAWHYIEVKRYLLSIFKKNKNGGRANISKYGEIIKSGWGKDPDKDIEKVKEEFQKKLIQDLGDSAKSDMTPLHVALVNANFAVARLFIENGANVNALDVFKLTPLHYACMHGDADMAKTLLAKGADINAKNVDGLSPEDVARKNEQTSLVHVLTADSNYVSTVLYGRSRQLQEKNEIKPQNATNIIWRQVMPTAQAEQRTSCAYQDLCAEFVKSKMNILDEYLNKQYDMCYCYCCIRKREDRPRYPRGEPPKDYSLPIGWTRLAIKVAPHVDAQKLFEKWHRAYHGTSVESAELILQSGELLFPGDKTMHGRCITPRPGHFDENNKPNGFNVKQLFVSPSINYAGLKPYATPTRFVSQETGKAYDASVVLQLLIKTDSYVVGPETVGARIRGETIDQHLPNSELEWAIERRCCIVIYGIMVKLA